MYTISEIVKATGTNWYQQSTDAAVEHLLLDSRKLIFPGSSLFFSLGGPRRSGNAFIAELYQKGVRNFVTGTDFTDTTGFPNANFIHSADVLKTLQQLSAFHRKHFTLPVIGITGSNGKTIVKEWLYQLLHTDQQIVRSPKSYNSQIGVPLSIWQLNTQHTLGIFEAGISQPGEMQQLEKMIRPSIGVFTNIGEAHSEGFLDIRQKINEKLQLFVNAGLLIYGCDHADLSNAVLQFAAKIKQQHSIELLSWGHSENARIHIRSIEKKGRATTIHISDNRIVNNSLPFSFQIPFTDDAAVENAITCCCVLLSLNYTADVIAERMSQLKPVEMRLELKKGINHCSVINDSYSADINSLTIALDFLSQQQQHPNRTLILSDILQSGKSGAELYNAIAAILQQKKINRFIGIGPEISRHQQAFAPIAEKIFFGSVAEFKSQFHALHFFNETILLKGARVFEFEQISHLLEEKAHQTVLEINLSAITHNLKKYQQLLQPGTKLMAMVKAFSYGSGSFEIANLLQFHKIDYLTVAYADEGVELRKAGIQLPIMVMNAEEATFDMLVQYNLEPELYSFGILHAFGNYLEQQGISNFPIHIKLDTGMRRLGFESQDADTLCHHLNSSNLFKIQSVFSHLTSSDNPAHDDFTFQQAQLFVSLCERMQQLIPYPFLRHLANTSAIHRHPQLQFDMVRLGIGLYGVDNNETMQQELRNVSTLKTTIAQIKKLKPGESVGYNRGSSVTQDSTIATVRIGYADGYPRNLSRGAGKMWVNGKLAPVIGNVCMDMTMLDVTGIDVKEGDDVIVFGEQLPVSKLAEWSGTIAYEILTGISQRVKRVYFEE